MVYRFYLSKIILASAILTFLSFFGLATVSFAATLSITPATGTYTVGVPFSSTVVVSSADQAANALSGVITFPADRLAVTSLSKNNSVVTYWVSEPTFSNATGQIKFEGVVPNPGFSGTGKRVLTITFRPKVIGAANLKFTEGSVLANDGQGTNILADSFGANYAIAPAELKAPAPEATTVIGAPGAPQVMSPTHPDPTAWYSNSNPMFKWEMPVEATGVNVLANHSPSTNPGTISDGLFPSYDYKEVKDGKWYFHLRLRNAGGWGDITHFGFNIDTVPPTDFKLVLLDRPDLTAPEVAFNLTATDTVSGVDRYELSVDNASSTVWSDTGDHRFTTSRLKPGAHTLLAKVFDKAGNNLAGSVDFSVAPLPAPKITDYPREIATDKIITLRGETLVGSLVTLTFKHPDDSQTSLDTRTDQAGNFMASVDGKLKEGIYTVTAIARDDRGAESVSSESVVISVFLPALWQWLNGLLSWLSLVVPILALLILLILIIVWSIYRMQRMKRKVRRESREAAEALHKAFDFLREKSRDQLALLEAAKARRVLTKEEVALADSLRQSLNDVEQYVQKEIGDIEKLVD